MARILLAILFLPFAASARDLNTLYTKGKLHIGNRDINVFVADNESLRRDGLMFITQLEPDQGMLFIFEDERPLAFWMKNTLIPLSIGYFDAQGVLVDIQEMKVAESMMVENPPSYPSRKPAKFALEMNRGWFTEANIKVGARLKRRGTTASKSLQNSLPASR